VYIGNQNRVFQTALGGTDFFEENDESEAERASAQSRRRRARQRSSRLRAATSRHSTGSDTESGYSSSALDPDHGEGRFVFGPLSPDFHKCISLVAKNDFSLNLCAQSVKGLSAYVFAINSLLMKRTTGRKKIVKVPNKAPKAEVKTGVGSSLLSRMGPLNEMTIGEDTEFKDNRSFRNLPEFNPDAAAAAAAAATAKHPSKPVSPAKNSPTKAAAKSREGQLGLLLLKQGIRCTRFWMSVGTDDGQGADAGRKRRGGTSSKVEVALKDEVMVYYRAGCHEHGGGGSSSADLSSALPPSHSAECGVLHVQPLGEIMCPTSCFPVVTLSDIYFGKFARVFKHNIAANISGNTCLSLVGSSVIQMQGFTKTIKFRLHLGCSSEIQRKVLVAGLHAVLLMYQRHVLLHVNVTSAEAENEDHSFSERLPGAASDEVTTTMDSEGDHDNSLKSKSQKKRRQTRKRLVYNLSDLATSDLVSESGAEVDIDQGIVGEDGLSDSNSSLSAEEQGSGLSASDAALAFEAVAAEFACSASFSNTDDEEPNDSARITSPGQGKDNGDSGMDTDELFEVANGANLDLTLSSKKAQQKAKSTPKATREEELKAEMRKRRAATQRGAETSPAQTATTSSSTMTTTMEINTDMPSVAVQVSYGTNAATAGGEAFTPGVRVFPSPSKDGVLRPVGNTSSIAVEQFTSLDPRFFFGDIANPLAASSLQAVFSEVGAESAASSMSSTKANLVDVLTHSFQFERMLQRGSLFSLLELRPRVTFESRVASGNGVPVCMWCSPPKRRSADSTSEQSNAKTAAAGLSALMDLFATHEGAIEPGVLWWSESSTSQLSSGLSAREDLSDSKARSVSLSHLRYIRLHPIPDMAESGAQPHRFSLHFRPGTSGAFWESQKQSAAPSPEAREEDETLSDGDVDYFDETPDPISRPGAGALKSRTSDFDRKFRSPSNSNNAKQTMKPEKGRLLKKPLKTHDVAFLSTVPARTGNPSARTPSPVINNDKGKPQVRRSNVITVQADSAETVALWVYGLSSILYRQGRGIQSVSEKPGYLKVTKFDVSTRQLLRESVQDKIVQATLQAPTPDATHSRSMFMETVENTSSSGNIVAITDIGELQQAVQRLTEQNRALLQKQSQHEREIEDAKQQAFVKYQDLLRSEMEAFFAEEEQIILRDPYMDVLGQLKRANKENFSGLTNSSSPA